MPRCLAARTLPAPFDVQGQPGQLAIISVNIANATGLQIAAADIRLDIDESVIEPVAVRATPLSFRYAWNYGVSNSCRARTRMASTDGTASSAP